MKFCCLVFAIAALSTNVASAQSLWGETRSGMTVDEAKQIQPLAFTPSDPRTVAKTGNIELLRVEGLDLGAVEKFKASLYFSKTGKLQQVTLAPMASVNSYSGRSIFDSLFLGLKAKYGSPLNVNSKPDQALATWTSGKTKIEAFYSNFMDTVTIVQVVYTGDAIALGSGL